MKKVSSMECSLTCVSISRICHIKNVVRSELGLHFLSASVAQTHSTRNSIRHTRFKYRMTDEPSITTNQFKDMMRHRCSARLFLI